MLYLVQSTNTLDLQIKLVPFVSGISYHKFEVQDTKGCNIMEKEIWKPIKDYEGLYEVSTLGQVRSLRKGAILLPQNDNTGYVRVSLPVIGKKHIHRIVAETFLPNQANKRCVNHIDNNKLNNAVSNLEWVTHKENSQHTVRQGRFHKHGMTSSSKLTPKDVIEIRNSNEKQKVLAIIYKVSKPTISVIKSRITWKHVN